MIDIFFVVYNIGKMGFVVFIEFMCLGYELLGIVV